MPFAIGQGPCRFVASADAHHCTICRVPETDLADALVVALDDAAPTPIDRGELQRALAAFVESARADWPAIELSSSAFIGHLAPLLSRERDVLEVLPELSAPGLYIAYGCVKRHPGALAAFDKTMRDAVQVATARLRLDDARKDDLLQLVRKRLLVGDDDVAPKITSYSGRGALGAWTRVTALRMAYNFMAERAQRDLAPGANEDLVAAAASADPELDMLVSRYGPALNASLAEALEALEARECALLRYSFLETLSIDHIGAIYGVHRATAARWIANARERLFKTTRDSFRTKVAMSDSEFDSLLRSLRSYLDMSLDGVLGPPD